MATRIVPDDEEDDEEFRLKYIDTGLVSTSEISLMQAKNEIANFGLKTRKMIGFIPTLMTCESDKKYHKLLKRIAKYEDITDNIEVEISNFLTRISESEMSKDSSVEIRSMLKIIDDLESVGDVIYQISRIVDNNKQQKIHLTEKQSQNMNELYLLVVEAIEEMNKNLLLPYREVDPQKAFKLEHQINKKRDKMRQKHIDDLKEKKYKHKVGAYYSDLYSLTEKTGDYVINVTEAMTD